jgi:hypothetical protein
MARPDWTGLIWLDGSENLRGEGDTSWIAQASGQSLLSTYNPARNKTPHVRK